MPAKSAAQQNAAGAALTAKRGDRPLASLAGPSRNMAETMTVAELEALASTKRDDLPQHVKS